MANGAKRNGGDVVLGGRHLFGIFLLLVVIFGVIFTLGYLLGRSQYDGQIQAASNAPATVAHSDASPAKPAPAPRAAAEAPPADPPSDWDFYHSAEPAKPPAPLAVQPKAIPATLKPSAKPTAKAVAAVPAKSVANGTVPGKSAASPLLPKGATVLQVAALAHEADALALAQALQKKKFPAFVLDPPAGGADHFYRVQVGPYGDSSSANAVRHMLESQGFKSIIKR